MYYFVSDIHLGSGDKATARAIERRFVEWLQMVGEDAEGIFLCGDIFDFWFEYERVVPKGFVRVLGEITRLTDRGVRVVFMAGNHDMWIGEYLSEECGMELYTAPRIFELGGCKVHVAHGDNLNVKKDMILRMMNSTFRSKGVRSLFSIFVHPNLAIRFGRWWSGSSRKSHRAEEAVQLENLGLKYLVEYSEQQQRLRPCDYYVFGHLHISLSCKIDGSELFFMRDWSSAPSYVTLNRDGVMQLNSYEL